MRIIQVLKIRKTTITIVERKKYEKTKTHILLLPIETTGVSFLLGKFNRVWFSFRGVVYFSKDVLHHIDLILFVRFRVGGVLRGQVRKMT